MTLTEFLLARIAEDEAGAAAFGGQYPTWAGRLRAECQGKHHIIERWVSLNPEVPGFGNLMAHAYAQGLLEAIQILAAVYADHPDHRDEWRP